MGKATTRSNEPLRIAPSRNGGHWTVEDWANLDFAAEEDWQTAIDIFEDRIRYRFLDEVEAIQSMSFSGFAVMALDCLLIETLQQFRKGKPETPWGKAKSYFRDFLTGTAFKEHFTSDDQAEKFRDQIRNGVLHQAETKSTSRIWTRAGTPLVHDTPDGKGLEINRDLFHQKLVQVFEEYVEALRKNDPADQDLRNKFKNKMDFICRVGGIYHYGILAYGSLLTNPGKEIDVATVERKPVTTPFPVEYARSSGTRADAPTLVRVSGERGSNVKSGVLVLDPCVTEEEARNMLYRRERNCVGETSIVYDNQRQQAGTNAVVIKDLPDFAGIEVVLYTCLPANIDLLKDPTATVDQKAAELARRAVQSVTEETYGEGRDGIRYLADAISQGIHTPLTDLYKCAVLRLADDAPNLEEARLRIARQKGIIAEENQ